MLKLGKGKRGYKEVIFKLQNGVKGYPKKIEEEWYLVYCA